MIAGVVNHVHFTAALHTGCHLKHNIQQVACVRPPLSCLADVHLVYLCNLHAARHVVRYVVTSALRAKGEVLQDANRTQQLACITTSCAVLKASLLQTL